MATMMMRRGCPSRRRCGLFCRVVLQHLLLSCSAYSQRGAVDPDPRSRFTLADVFSDRMVLQAEPSSAVLWGRAAGALGQVHVKIDGSEVIISQHVEDTFDTDPALRSWRLELRPQPAGGPREVHIASEFLGDIFLREVLFGDVFICGGQSNMRMGMSDAHVEDIKIFNAAAEDGKLWNIRLLTLAEIAWRADNDVSEDRQSLSLVHEWMSVDSHTVFGPSVLSAGWNETFFSIVCLTFGVDTFHRLQGSRPIGLVSASHAGTPIEYHMPGFALQQCLDTDPDIGTGYHPRNLWVPQHPLGRIAPNVDGIIYAKSIAPLTGMAITAFLWYQGESNAHDPDAYRCLFASLIDAWRASFPRPRSEEALPKYTRPARDSPERVEGINRRPEQDQVPFIAVQLAADETSFRGLLARQRRAQLSAIALPNVAIVPALDLGDPKAPLGAIHPRNKRQIGRRMSAAAHLLVRHYWEREGDPADVDGRACVKEGSRGEYSAEAEEGELMLSVAIDHVSLRVLALDPKDSHFSTASVVQ